MSTDAKIVNVYADVARPILRRWMARNSCIAATRTAKYALGHFGLRLEPVVVQMVLQCPAAKYGFVSGFAGAAKDAMRAKATARGCAWMDRQFDAGDTWSGHVVGLVEGRYLLDSSIDQSSSEEHGFVLPAECLVVDLGDAGGAKLKEQGGLHLDMSLDDGRPFSIDYGVLTDRDDEYRETPAWNDDGLLTLSVEIARAMARVLPLRQRNRGV